MPVPAFLQRLLVRRQPHVAIDIGTSTLKLIELTRQGDRLALQAIGIQPVQLAAAEDGTLLTDRDSLAAAISRLHAASGARAKRAATAIAAAHAIVKNITMANMSDAELDDQIYWEAEGHIPHKLEELQLDYQVLHRDLERTSNERMEVLVAATRKAVMEEQLALFAAAGLELNLLDIDCFAIQNAFEHAYAPGEDEQNVLVAIGNTSTTINIVRGGVSLYNRTLALGGHRHTELLMSHCGLDDILATSVKRGASDASDEELAVITMANNNFALELKRNLDLYALDLRENLAGIYLTGGGSLCVNLAHDIQSLLGVGTEQLNPFQNIVVDPERFDPEYLEYLRPYMAVAIGLALREV